MLPPPCFTVWSYWRMNFCLFFKSLATSNMFSSWIVFYLNPSSYQLQLAFLSPRKKSMILRPQGSWWASLSNFSAINSFCLLAKMFSFGHSWQEDLLTQVCCLPNRKQSFSMLFFFLVTRRNPTVGFFWSLFHEVQSCEMAYGTLFISESLVG